MTNISNESIMNLQHDNKKKSKGKSSSSKLAEDQLDLYENLFLNIGLEEKVVKTTLSNFKITNCLGNLLNSMNITKCNKKTGNLLYVIASKYADSMEEHKHLIAKYVLDEKITTVSQLDLGIKFLKENMDTFKDQNKILMMEKKCGVGVVMTHEQIQCVVKEFIEKNKDQILESLATKKPNTILRDLRDMMPSVNPMIILQAYNYEIENLLARINLEKQEKSNSCTQNKLSEKIFKFMARDLTTSLNPPEILKAHLERTGGKIITRFPPEPNGYLHLGHAKAIRFNFLSATENNGICYLRFDDTNPEKESEDFIQNIYENVKWLGYTPYKITYASDYIGQMFDYAIQLIKENKAYICEQNQQEMQEFRKKGLPSPFRDRFMDENLRLFNEMKEGKFPEGRYCLRLKIDAKHSNPTLRDPVAFRIKYKPHPHTGTKWCIYPTYDFAHCIGDSIEDITHSLCTLEFEIRRDLYYWILDALKIYRPKVWEYSRMNISHNVLSKRKLARLVQEKIVDGWDDPRLLTLNGLRRRGYTPNAINEYCDLVSVTRRGNENLISIKVLEHCIRKDLDKHAPRTMAVINPIKLIIINVPEDFIRHITIYPFPKEPHRGKPYQITITKTLYVEASDIRLQDHKDYFGIAPNKIIGLRYAGLFKCVNIITNNNNDDPNEVQVEWIEEDKICMDGKLKKENVEEECESKNKVKSYLHWISDIDAIDIEIRIFEDLFVVEEPAAQEDFLKYVNKDSKKIVKSAKFNKMIQDVDIGNKYQFERIGYFCVDKDSDIKKQKYVFNKTISLIEKEKNKINQKNTKD